MARRATIDDILKGGEKDLEIPGLLDSDGQPMTLRVRKVHAGERDALMPPLPAHLYENLPDEPKQRLEVLGERRTKWLGGLTPAELEARTQEAGQFFARLVARASVDPVLTEGQAQRLGDSVVALANEIIAFSQNRRDETKPAATAD